jgi:hypothetical protein
MRGIRECSSVFPIVLAAVMFGHAFDINKSLSANIALHRSIHRIAGIGIVCVALIAEEEDFLIVSSY